MIFVDVRGTLLDERDQPVEAVVAAVIDAHDRLAYEITVWSGDGAEFAEEVARRLFGDRPIPGAGKDSRLLLTGDRLVDDDVEPWRRALNALQVAGQTPAEFVEWAAAQADPIRLSAARRRDKTR